MLIYDSELWELAAWNAIYVFSMRKYFVPSVNVFDDIIIIILIGTLFVFDLSIACFIKP